jgi:hypothetical protein
VQYRAAALASRPLDRGTEEARQQLAVLREKWPLAFPVKHQDVRPLAIRVAREGWSLRIQHHE